MSDPTKKPKKYATPDDAAMAWDYMLRLRNPSANKYEFASGIVPNEDGYSYSEPRTSRRPDEFTVALPAASEAIIHNHPIDRDADKGSRQIPQGLVRKFSMDDTAQATELGRNSYVSADDRVYKYNPKTKDAEEVLGEVPIEELREERQKKYPHESTDGKGLPIGEVMRKIDWEELAKFMGLLK